MLGTALGLIVILMLSATGYTEEVPRIDKEKVKGMLGNPDVIIIDIQKVADLKIKGAVREDPERLLSRIQMHPKNKTLILYCS